MLGRLVLLLFMHYTKQKINYYNQIYKIYIFLFILWLTTVLVEKSLYNEKTKHKYFMHPKNTSIVEESKFIKIYIRISMGRTLKDKNKK